MDNFIVSARKYRPVTFKQVVGQQSITNTLQNAIKNNHLAQAFLFTGPRGVGKTTCARILAKTINCTNLNSQMEPCDQCESCKSFNNNSSFNIHELDAASNNSVEDIRNLVEQVRIPPQVGKYKVYIIDEVHMLSQSAFNAFLKTLEEPPAYAKFILATTEKHKIIPTILSRCQIFDFRRILVEDIAEYLHFVAEQEGIVTEPEALHIIGQKSDGALRDALSTFDQIVSYSGSTLTYKHVIDNLNILDYEYYFRIVNFILDNNRSGLLLLFNEVIENGFDGQHFILGLADHFRNLLVIKNPETVKLMHASEQLKDRYTVQANQCSIGFLFKVLEICDQYDLNYKGSNNKRLHIEIALMAMAELVQSSPVNTQPSKSGYNSTHPVSESATSKKSHPSDSDATKPVTGHNREMGTIPISHTKTLSEPEKEKSMAQDISETSYHSSAQPQAERSKTDQHNSLSQVEPERKTRQVDHKSINQDSNSTTIVPATKKVHHVTGSKGIRNISIANTINNPADKDSNSEQPEPIIDNKFSQELLEKTWTDFCTQYETKSPSFAHALAKYTPELQDNNVINYKVDSMIIAQDFIAVNSLLDYLKTTLNNNQIQLTPLVVDKNEPKKAYTDREKMERLAEKYPQVSKLQDQFNLEIGF